MVSEKNSESSRTSASDWQDFHNRFLQLAKEEEANPKAIREDRLLRAYCDYKKHPEIWAEKGKPEQGSFCLLKAPETGLWIISDGMSENFQARFRSLAARAGVALGSPQGADVEDFWLHRLYFDLLENNSDQLFAASKEGGVIRRVCVASSTFCLRLERKALETNGAEEQRCEAFIYRAIATRKRMESSVSGEIRDANPSVLDAQKSRALLGIEVADLENLRRVVWMKSWNEARLPRAVEVEWESVLSSQKMPDSHVDLGLTFALTQEYQMAISWACAQLADLLATAVGSRINQAHLREAIWRECLDFGYQLAQWDAFGSWVDRVAGIRWKAPLTADGATDLKQLEKAVKPRRDFFENRIGMYSQDWLSAIDRAIFAARTVNASSETERQVLEAGLLSRPHEAALRNSAPHLQLNDREKRIWVIIQRGAKGLQYCRELDSAGIAPLRKGIWKDCPRKYESAYLQGKPWRHRIQDEKSKVRRKAELEKLASE